VKNGAAVTVLGGALSAPSVLVFVPAKDSLPRDHEQMSAGEAGMTQVAVAGAGPAGAALSYLLARRGIDVVLLERQTDFAREFRGEALMSTGVEAVRQMGSARSWTRCRIRWPSRNGIDGQTRSHRREPFSRSNGTSSRNQYQFILPKGSQRQRPRAPKQTRNRSRGGGEQLLSRCENSAPIPY
jgi:hypothetical protein